MKENKSKYRTVLAVALALFVISPLDDVLIAALFGTAIFGLGSMPFYIFVGASLALSIVFWRRHMKREKRKALKKITNINQPRSLMN